MPNIKIKSFRSSNGVTAATSKFQLLDPDTIEDGVRIREKGYRALEPGEVVEVSDELADACYATGVIELTPEKPNRPLYFGDAHTAYMTSATFPVNDENVEKEVADAKKRASKLVPKPKKAKAKNERDSE